MGLVRIAVWVPHDQADAFKTAAKRAVDQHLNPVSTDIPAPLFLRRGVVKSQPKTGGRTACRFEMNTVTITNACITVEVGGKSSRSARRIIAAEFSASSKANLSFFS
jgi:hypothetical protein